MRQLLRSARAMTCIHNSTLQLVVIDFERRILAPTPATSGTGSRKQGRYGRSIGEDSCGEGQSATENSDVGEAGSEGERGGWQRQADGGMAIKQRQTRMGCQERWSLRNLCTT
jgi:hypothetical protein